MYTVMLIVQLLMITSFFVATIVYSARESKRSKPVIKPKRKVALATEREIVRMDWDY